MPLPGADFEVTVHLTLEEANRGTQVDLNVTLPEVDGEGRVRSVPKSLKARIPKGATDGQRLRLRGQGGKGARGGRDGDLYLNIVLDPHPLFRPTGHDLYLDLPLSPWEAALGASVEVPTLSGAVRLKVAPGTPAGRKLRFPGKGLSKPGGGEGDLYAIVQIVNPADAGRARARALREPRRGIALRSPRPFSRREAPWRLNATSRCGWMRASRSRSSSWPNAPG